MKKITVVTGLPRSGTSLMMQTLNTLGLNTKGTSELWHRQKTKLGRDRAEYLNPKGFYEIPGIVTKGIRFDKLAELFYNKTIKIILNGLIRTDLKHIDKILFCFGDDIKQ